MMTRPIPLASLMLLACVGSTSAQPDATGPARGLDELVAHSKTALAAFDDPVGLEGAMHHTMRLAALWDVYFWRFKAQPEAGSGWAGFHDVVRAIQKRAIGGDSTDAPYFSSASAQIIHAVTLELLGHDEGAERALDSIRAGGPCGNWVATVELQVASRRSAILARRGDHSASLSQLRKAFSQQPMAQYCRHKDILLAREGRLLAQTGDVDAARHLWQRLVDLYPGTVGAELSRAELIRAGCLVEPTVQSLDKYLRKGNVRAISSVATQQLPGALERLRDLLARWDEDSKPANTRLAIICALGDLGDREAIKDVLPLAARGSVDQRIAALTALLVLGDDSQITGVLKYVASREIYFHTNMKLDPPLRTFYGRRGPPISEFWLRIGRPDEIADAWLAWLDEQGRDID